MVILRSKDGNQKVDKSTNEFEPELLEDIDANHSAILSKLFPHLENTKFEGVSKDKRASLEERLSAFEDKDVRVNKKFKFGVLLCKASQTTEEEMFGNQNGSDHYQQFLSILGDKVVLAGHEGFNGGLDVKRNTTGEHSVYTTFRGNQIMFHCSTLLPQSDTDQQQLHKKRHIGEKQILLSFFSSSFYFRE